MKKHNTKGFTLIEILVVVAIIGILSAVVLTALGPSRTKAKDTRIISGVNQVRAIAEIWYSSHTNAYTGLSPSATDLTNVNADIRANGGVLAITVSDDGTAYAAYSKVATLSGNSTQYYCVDSAGNSKLSTTNQSGSVCQ